MSTSSITSEIDPQGNSVTCVCESAQYPFFCQRHGCEKTEHWQALCKNRQDYFQLWEEGRGPGQKTPANARLIPCRHRGTEPVEQVACELCGARHVLVPVYECGLWGTCTERRWGTRHERARSMPACLTCEAYDAAASDNSGKIS